MKLQLVIKKIYILFFLILLTSYGFGNEVFVSLKKNKVNVRYGPSFESDIKYVYKKINFPLKQIDKKENFRRIIDFKNNSGWIHVSQLRNVNSIIPLTDKILFKKPSKFSKPLANVKRGRVLVVIKFDDNWCKVKSDEFKGWITNKGLWGKID